MAKKKEGAKSLNFTDEADRPTYKLRNGDVVPMSDARIAAMKEKSWKEGQSGNPAGCPPGIPETKLKLHQHTDEAIAVLRNEMLNGDNAGARVKAALAFITPFVAPAPSKQEVDVNVNVNNPISKFLMMVTEDFEKDPSLLIDVTPNKENP